jgi:hypothetical protein
MSYPHTGIRIDRIPAEEGGGLIFALGMALISLVAFPALLPVAGAALVGGAVLAPALRWLHRKGPAFVGIVSPRP